MKGEKKKLKIRRKYNPSDVITIFTKAGTSVVPVFSLSEDESKVVVVGKKNIAKEVDSFRDSTDINVILHQLSVNDTSMFERLQNGDFTAKEGMFFDSTVFPRTIREYKNMVSITNEVYNNLPKEITSQFNSIDDFVKSDDSKLKSVFDSYRVKIEAQNNENTEIIDNTQKGDI